MRYLITVWVTMIWAMLLLLFIVNAVQGEAGPEPIPYFAVGFLVVAALWWGNHILDEREHASWLARQSAARDRARAADTDDVPPPAQESRSEADTWHERAYGRDHRALRAAWMEIVNEYGAECHERVCIMPSRRIEKGAFFHLAHDHDRGGPNDYLGPAHPECNEHEYETRTGDRDGEENGSREPRPTSSGNDPWAAPGVEDDGFAPPF